MPDFCCEEFKEKIEGQYLEEARRHVAKRRSKFMKAINFIKDKEEEGDSLPAEPSSSQWEYSNEDYEGGAPEMKTTNSKIKKPLNPKQPKKKKKNIVKTENQILLGKTNKIKGKYSKVPTKGAVIREQKEKHTEYENFYKACDLYLNENNVLFDYQDYDETMKSEELEQQNPALFINQDINGVRWDEYNPADKDDYYSFTPVSHFSTFNILPNYEGFKYVPPLFREKYELCIWKLDTHNWVKIKNRYFTPEVISIHFPILI